MNFKKINVQGNEIPQPTSSHGIASLLNEPTVVLFGGMQSDYKRKNPTWTFDTGKKILIFNKFRKFKIYRSTFWIR